MDFGDIAALLSLPLSAYAIWTTLKFNERQLSLIRSQKRLNDLLLRQGENENIEALKAEMGANIVKLGSSKYRLKIFNKGKAAAKNITVEFPDGNEFVVESDLREKFPMEIMEPFQSVELIASIHMGTKAKHPVKLSWADQNRIDNEKTVYVTI